MKSIRSFSFVLILTLIGIALNVSILSAQIALVVHPDNPIERISSEDLARIYLGKLTTYPDRGEIALLEYQPLGELFYDQLLGMTPIKFKKHWMRLVFSGAYATPPVVFQKFDDLAEYLAGQPQSLGFVKSDKVTDELKLIRIDGLLPDDEGYLFIQESAQDSSEVEPK